MTEQKIPSIFTSIKIHSLTEEELAFQCASIAQAAIDCVDPSIREALLFVLVEKNSYLFEMLTTPV